MFEVLERFVEGKSPDHARCEDALYVDRNFVAVFDGATNGDTVFADGRAPGRVAVDILQAAMASVPASSDGPGTVRFLDAAIAAWYRAQGLHERLSRDVQGRVSASAVIFSAARREIWMIGDCQALVGGVHLTNTKRTDNLMEEVRAFVLESELLSGATIESLLREDRGRAAIDALIRRQRHFQNRASGSPYDYYVLDGFLPTSAPLVVRELPAGPVEVILSSDGYPHLRPTLAATEAELHAVLVRDPLLFREVRSTKGAYPGNRSFDDRTYVRIMVP